MVGTNVRMPVSEDLTTVLYHTICNPTRTRPLRRRLHDLVNSILFPLKSDARGCRNKDMSDVIGYGHYKRVRCDRRLVGPDRSEHFIEDGPESLRVRKAPHGLADWRVHCRNTYPVPSLRMIEALDPRGRRYSRILSTDYMHDYSI